jgi:acetyl esterase/lipase
MPSDAYLAILDALLQQERSPGTPFADQRAGYDAFADLHPLPADASTEPASGAPVPSLWVRARGAADDAVLIWFHGGGYVIGSARGCRRLGADVSAASGASVLLPDYRLAPEHPFPAAVEDAVAVCTWLLDGGTSAERIVLGGDSAGGGLAVAALVALRDRGVALPAGAVLLSPLADLTLSSSSWETRRALDPLVGDHNAPEMAAAYLGDVDPTTPLASPVFADLRGLPPLLILVGDHEVLRDDSVTLAARAQEAGVPVTLRVFEELHHIWPWFASDTDEGKEAVAAIAAFVRSHVDHVDATTS